MISDVQIDHAGIGKYLMGPEVRSLVRGSAEEVEALYRGMVARKTGRLASSTHIETFVGGRKNDRWCARLVADAPYAAAHEFSKDGGELRRALSAWEAK